MNDIKVGDIVEPKTKYRREWYGKGIVYSINETGSQRIAVIFKPEHGATLNHPFSDDKLRVVTPNAREKFDLLAAKREYFDLMEEIKKS